MQWKIGFSGKETKRKLTEADILSVAIQIRVLENSNFRFHIISDFIEKFKIIYLKSIYTLMDIGLHKASK